MRLDDWPKPPIWPEDLPLIRELLTDEEYAELLKRMVHVVRGPGARERQEVRRSSVNERSIPPRTPSRRYTTPAGFTRKTH